MGQQLGACLDLDRPAGEVDIAGCAGRRAEQGRAARLPGGQDDAWIHDDRAAIDVDRSAGGADVGDERRGCRVALAGDLNPGASSGNGIDQQAVAAGKPDPERGGGEQGCDAVSNENLRRVAPESVVGVGARKRDLAARLGERQLITEGAAPETHLAGDTRVGGERRLEAAERDCGIAEVRDGIGDECPASRAIRTDDREHAGAVGILDRKAIVAAGTAGDRATQAAARPDDEAVLVVVGSDQVFETDERDVGNQAGDHPPDRAPIGSRDLPAGIASGPVQGVGKGTARDALDAEQARRGSRAGARSEPDRHRGGRLRMVEGVQAAPADDRARHARSVGDHEIIPTVASEEVFERLEDDGAVGVVVVE